jgi:hypothetical protein
LSGPSPYSSRCNRTRCKLSRSSAAQGRCEEAEELTAESAGLAEAVAIGEQTDFVDRRGDTLVDLAHILQEAGREEEAAEIAAEGLHLHEQKGNVVTAGKIRLQFGALV